MIFNEHIGRILANIWDMINVWFQDLFGAGMNGRMQVLSNRTESFWMLLLGVELLVTAASLAWLLAWRTEVPANGGSGRSACSPG